MTYTSATTIGSVRVVPNISYSSIAKSVAYPSLVIVLLLSVFLLPFFFIQRFVKPQTPLEKNMYTATSTRIVYTIICCISAFYSLTLLIAWSSVIRKALMSNGTETMYYVPPVLVLLLYVLLCVSLLVMLYYRKNHDTQTK